MKNENVKNYLIITGKFSEVMKLLNEYKIKYTYVIDIIKSMK